MTSKSSLGLAATGLLWALATGAPASAQTAPSAQTSPAPAAKPAKKCFYGRNINGWNSIDDRSLILSVGVNDQYLVKLFATCPELRFTEVVGVRNRGSDWVCTDDKFDIIVNDPTTGERICPADSMVPITAEEAKALRSKKKR